MFKTTGERKPKKTDDICAYMREYRKNNKTHVNNLEISRYYKKKGEIKQEIIDKFGSITGCVVKLSNMLKDTVNRNEEDIDPVELKGRIIEYLQGLEI